MTKAQHKRDQDKAKRRDDIIDAAEALALETGWEQVTVGAVAKRAGLSRALLYLYFDNKTDLHTAIAERARRELLKRFEDALDGSSGLDRFTGLGHAYVNFARDCPHYFEAISRFEAANLESSSPTKTSEEITANPVHRLIVQTLEEEVMHGTVRPDLSNLNMVAINLWAFTHGLIQISTNKRNQLEKGGIQTPALMQSAFDMIRKSIAA